MHARQYIVNMKHTIKRASVMASTVVPRHFRDRTGSAQKAGVKAEQMFQQKCIDNNLEWRPSTKQENMIDHIDCYVKFQQFQDEKSIDVKAAKKLVRWHPKPQDTWLWVEWVGRSGKPGWVRSSKLDFVAFEMLNKNFLVVDRKELESHVATLVEQNKTKKIDTVTDAKNGILYSRQGNKDQLTLIKSEDLVFLKNSFFL